jgi:4-amino-4-deoxy-L-arabinose transferase-like glycosyltransferase
MLIPAFAALILPAIAADWRKRSYLAVLATAIAGAAVLVGCWLGAARLHAPVALKAWLDFQLGAFAMPSGAALADYGSTLSWSAWPAWPIALWALWERRRRLIEAGYALPLAALVATAAVLVCTRDVREVNALPLLLPLALLAGAGVPLLRRGAASALAWFGAMTFTFFGLLVWLGWFAMMTGTPATIARNFAKLEPGFVAEFGWIGFALAIAFTLGWLALMFQSERSPLRSVMFWSGGTALLWGLIMILWLPWIDYGKTYSPVAAAIKKALPAGARCIESRGLGESQRAAFDYHAEIVTRRGEIGAPAACPVLLVQASPGEDDGHLAPQWRRIWEGSRPRDKERYRLYVRTR